MDGYLLGLAYNRKTRAYSTNGYSLRHCGLSAASTHKFTFIASTHKLAFTDSTHKLAFTSKHYVLFTVTAVLQNRAKIGVKRDCACANQCNELVYV